MEISRFDFDRDFTDVMFMCRAMHAGSIFSSLRLDSSKLASFLIEAGSDEQWYFYTARDARCVGFMIGVLQEHFFSRDLYAVDQLLWVEPDYRGTLAAAMLVDGYKVWCSGNGVKLPMIGSSTGINIDRTKAFYERSGFECVGHNFILRN